MPQNQPQPVEEALNDAAPYDISGALNAHIRERLPLLKKQARSRGEAVVSRAQLGLVITGDETARNALASAYARALQGYEINPGRDDVEGPVVNRVQWRDIISNDTGNPVAFGRALDKLYAAKMDAEGGVLVIENIYDLPLRDINENAVTQAQNGAYQMLHDLMTEYAEKDYTPVVVLTGEADKMAAFLAKNRNVAEYFPGPRVAAATPLPPPVAVHVETDAPVTVNRPLKLKRFSP
jgi:hypothetical protein